MDDSRNQPELETLSYKPECAITGQPKCNCTDCNIPAEQPASAPPTTLGFNSHVIKPETRVNKGESAQKGIIDNYGPVAKKRIKAGESNPEQLPGRLHTKGCECGNCPEQPNQNIMILEQAEGATKVVLELLKQIEPYNTDQRGDVQGCIWTLEGWFNHNLKHLKKAFE